MATNLQVNDTVYVPTSLLNLDPEKELPHALYTTKVVQVVDRSIRLRLPDGRPSDLVAKSSVHRNVGVLIFRVGDFETELATLDPLAKSILQYFRLLLPDDMVRLREVRSIEELRRYWGSDHGGYTHIVLVGHGRRDAISFGIDGWIDAEGLSNVLADANPSEKSFVSLCCATGYSDFSRSISEQAFCHGIVAPYHSVHAAVASQFCQTLFGYHFLQGETLRIAFKHARRAVPGGSIFRLWDSGRLERR